MLASVQGVEKGSKVAPHLHVSTRANLSGLLLVQESSELNPAPHLQDFKVVAKNPALVGLGAALQYTIMPLMGFLVSRLANLPSAAAVGWASLFVQPCPCSCWLRVCLDPCWC